jgi:hypothetical protein
MRLVAGLVTLWLLVTAIPVAGQSIGGVSLRLGETRAETLRLLSQAYTVDSSSGLVRSKAGPHYVFPGVVGFSDGRLVWVSRSWMPQSQDHREVVRAVVAALGSGVGETATRACNVTHWRQSAPDTEQQGVDLICEPGHAVRIAVVRLSPPGSTEPKDFVLVEETWGSRPGATAGRPRQ